MSTHKILSLVGLVLDTIGASLLVAQGRWYSVTLWDTGTRPSAHGGELMFWSGWLLMIAGFILQILGHVFLEED